MKVQQAQDEGLNQKNEENNANKETLPAATVGLISMISSPTGLEIPIALKPTRVPIA